MGYRLRGLLRNVLRRTNNDELSTFLRTMGTHGFHRGSSQSWKILNYKKWKRDLHRCVNPVSFFCINLFEMVYTFIRILTLIRNVRMIEES